MINILYLHAGAEMYGADKILLELVSGLDKKKFNPVVILPSNGILANKLRGEGIKTYIIDYPILRRKYFNINGILSFSLNYFKKSKDIINLLMKINFQPDIIHVNTLAVLEGIYLKNKLEAKLLWHVHEIIEKPKFISVVLNFLVGKYSDKCIVVSNAVRDHLLNSKFIKKSKIKVIHNGIDSKEFNPNINCNYLFKEFNVPTDSIKVGVIGRINAWKGQNDFLDAATPLLKEYPNLYLFIIGSAFTGQEWRIDEIKNKIKNDYNRSRIIYSPFRSDNAAVQNFLNILVLPSTSPDPLPTVVLEAMASGKPIIGYDHGGIKEMVLDGYNGYLVEPNNCLELRRKMQVLIKSEEKRKNFGVNSLNRQINKFSMSSFIKKFSSTYTLIGNDFQ
ncbi:glycosyltransferase family 4 protein [Liquorilactobacillus vini]|uniref:Glycosyltransferase n=2 Tax=Liquorilactobacillus vini TaxID=238015 RepID=A0A0R2C5V6_9LACO|nr:glycosyltransferase family 4 protein [Liquorilactobacillus vini]KRM85204.1 glycosyltransferase [Liquorilactobacillus vini DSM 20605]